jgi:hypothetical protein
LRYRAPPHSADDIGTGALRRASASKGQGGVPGEYADSYCVLAKNGGHLTQKRAAKNSISLIAISTTDLQAVFYVVGTGSENPFVRCGPGHADVHITLRTVGTSTPQTGKPLPEHR